MGGMAAARMTDEIGHVGMWARLARTALRVGSMVAEGLLVAGAIAAVAVVVATAILPLLPTLEPDAVRAARCIVAHPWATLAALDMVNFAWRRASLRGTTKE